MSVQYEKTDATNAMSAAGPSETAGLQVGDVITKFAGKDITTASDLVSTVRDSTPGDKVDMTYYRGDNKQTGSLTIGSRTIRS